MKKKFTSKASNAIESAAPASVWGKGVPGKGKTSTNKPDKKENDK